MLEWLRLEVRLYRVCLLGSLKTGKKDSPSFGKIIFMLLIIGYVAVVFGLMFGIMFDKILKPFRLIGYEWLYFGIMAILVVLLCFVGSVFVTQQEIYGAKDNELLLAMPIKTIDILLSRVFVLLIVNYLYEAFNCYTGNGCLFLSNIV